MITQKELKELLVYDQESGIFTWKNQVGRKIKAGAVAGCINKKGYRVIGIMGILYKAHRLAWLYMTGEWPEQIDHDDHVRDNNKWDNLFNVTHAENGKNRSKSIANTSGVTGVVWDKRDSRWRSRMIINESNKSLGSFIDKFEAVCARKSAENKNGYHANHGQ